MIPVSPQPEPAALRRQAFLPMTVSERVALVSIDTARGVLGVDAESVSALVDNGRLLWVWDFALSPRASARRELRFWRLELINFSAHRRGEAAVIGVHDLLLPTVIDTILPASRSAFHAAELQQLFTISAQALHRFVEGKQLLGGIKGRTLWITRSSLVAFFELRLCK